MDKQLLDRIIINSNAKMEKIIRWYLNNQTWIDKEEFHAPLERGLVILEEEGIEFTFENKGSVVELAIYPNAQNIAMMTYDYNPISKTFNNYRFPAHLTKERRQMLEAVAKIDRTDYKEAIKYHALMVFAVYYQQIVEVDKSRDVKLTKHEAKLIRKSSKQPLSLVRKTYVTKEFSEKELTAHGEKRHYTKPEREVQVRGFFRKNQKGKVSWVRPFSRYKDKGNKNINEYRGITNGTNIFI